MLTAIFAALFGVGVQAALFFGFDVSLGWSIFFGFASFFAAQAAAGVALQRRVKAVMAGVQGILVAGQKQLQAKTARWQMSGPGSVQAAQAEIARDTKVFVKAALAETEKLHRFDLWVPLMSRQIATAKLQLYWMIGDFEAVDSLMDKALFVDSDMTAVRMARMYMKGEPDEAIEKVYRRAFSRSRYNGCVLPSALWAWILVKRGNPDGAFKALVGALGKSDDPVLKANHANLRNNRVNQFSNAGLGDRWYALRLEEPRIRMERPRREWR